MRFRQIFVMSLSLAVSISSFAQKKPNVGFESAEHIFMGDQVVLKGLELSAKQQVQLPLQNGLKLTYGDIVAMPDYYGEPNHQISSEPTFALRKQHFTEIFNQFSTYDVNYFNAFWPIIQNEQKSVANAIKHHQSVPDVFKKIGTKETIDLEKATHGRYLALVSKCMDHFNSDAWLAYQAGHSVAIDTAISAFNISNGEDKDANQQCAGQKYPRTCLKQLSLGKLKIAYEQNGYANHFLSDRLAAGHMRTPFRALLTTRPIAALGGLAGKYMHDEDNHLSVIVTNSSGNYWQAFGDDYYFTPEARNYHPLIKKILQLSANEVFAAYKTGANPDYQSTQLKTLLPMPIPAGQNVRINGKKLTQAAALFKVINGQVWERKDVNDRYDDHWIKGWSTIKLILTYKLNKISQFWQHYWLCQADVRNCHKL